MRITLRQMEIFRAVCQEGTVTGAAQEIGLSQAAVSQAIAELENLLERALFDRRGKRVVLNGAGRQLLPAAVQILDRVKGVERSRASQESRLRLSASLTVGDYMLPPIIAAFVRRNPSCRIEARIRNSEDVVDSLTRFETDAGWIEGSMQHPDLNASVWRLDRLLVVGAPTHPLAGQRAGAEQLAGANWVLREQGSGTRSVFENAIGGKFQPRVVAELAGIEAVKRTVMAGAGLGCISRWAIVQELEAGLLAPVRTPWLDLSREIMLLIHRSRYIDPVLRQFLEFSARGKWNANTRRSARNKPEA